MLPTLFPQLVGDRWWPPALSGCPLPAVKEVVPGYGSAAQGASWGLALGLETCGARLPPQRS